MIDVASAAGVSLSTVSRSLSGNAGVSETTRNRIRKIAEELGYVVSPEASRLSSGRTGRVGFVTPTINEWFYASVIAGATLVLAAHGIDVMLYPVTDSASRAAFFDELPARRKVDALIVIAFPLTDYEWERLDSMHVHAVVVGILDPLRPSVGVDDEEVGRQAAHHLLALGHVRPGMITCVDPEGFHYSSDISRERGFRVALAEAGHAIDEDLVVSVPWGIDGGATGMNRLMSLPRLPSAVFAFSDEVAFGALRSLRRVGLEVPEDISLIGVDDHPMAESVDLTTIRQDPIEQGRAAARLCLDLLNGDSPLQQIRHETSLIPRRSTMPPHGRDPELRGRVTAP
ncbi:LacI family DNA-binding transcriptional regulator [Microbacterium xylanilyticum]